MFGVPVWGFPWDTLPEGGPPTGQQVFCRYDFMLLGHTAPERHPSIHIFLGNYKARIKAFLDSPGLAQAWESIVGFRKFDAFADTGYVATN